MPPPPPQAQEVPVAHALGRSHWAQTFCPLAQCGMAEAEAAVAPGGEGGKTGPPTLASVQFLVQLQPLSAAWDRGCGCGCGGQLLSSGPADAPNLAWPVSACAAGLGYSGAAPGWEVPCTHGLIQASPARAFPAGCSSMTALPGVHTGSNLVTQALWP